MNDNNWKLGQTSMYYETGGHGAATVSSGIDDPGGVSYGCYQMTSQIKTKSGHVIVGGTVAVFIKNSKYADDFTGLMPGSAEFSAKWKSVANADPDFSKQQHDYIKITHYDKLVEHLKEKGVDLSMRGPAVQDMLWSTAVQYGPGSDKTPGGSGIFLAAIEGKFGKVHEISKLSDKDIINAVQEYKFEHVKQLFPRVNNPRTLDSLKNRAENEKVDLLKLADAHKLFAKIGVDQTWGAKDAAKHTVSRDIDAVERTAVQAYDTLTHPGQWFQHGAPAAVQSHAHVAAQHDTPIVGGPTTGHMPHPPATAKAPHPLTTTHPLEPGDRGAAVQALQQHLQTLGVTDRDGNAIQDDKDYGPRTQQAVEKFQRLAGREPTGIADPGTLEALHTHAEFAARHKAQHLAPDRHLADHAQPAPSRSSDAITQHSAPPRPDQPPAQQQPAPKALEPYSSPTSPLHALYAQTKATIENRGVSMSEERMHQLVGKMALQGITTEGKNDFAVKGDTLYGCNLDVPYNRFMLDLREPAPSVQSTLQQVQTQLQTQEAELTAMRQQQQQSYGR